MAAAMPAAFLSAGLRFFAAAMLVALVLLAVAPLDVVRLLCVFALVCAAAGFTWHFLALRAIDPGVLTALRARTGFRFRHVRNGVLRAVNATHDATEAVWPGVLR